MYLLEDRRRRIDGKGYKVSNLWLTHKAVNMTTDGDIQNQLGASEFWLTFQQQIYEREEYSRDI